MPLLSAQNRQKLKKRRDFLNTYKGKFLKFKYGVVYWTPNKTGAFRVGVTVPKLTGTAVQRNKFKRWVRSIIKDFSWLNMAKMSGLDLHIFVGNKRFSKADYKALLRSEFEATLSICLRKVDNGINK